MERADGVPSALIPTLYDLPYPTAFSDSTDYRRWALAFRSREAACLRGAAGFFAEPFRAAGAAARLGAFAAGFAFAEGRRLSLARLGSLATFGLAAFFGCGFVVADVAALAVTFSTGFASAGLLVFSTSLPVGTAAGTAATGGGADAAFVDPFGLPPFRANCASANIFLKASCASAIN